LCFRKKSEEQNPDQEEAHEFLDVIEACRNKLNKKSELLCYFQVVNELNNDVGDDQNVQENVKDTPKV